MPDLLTNLLPPERQRALVRDYRYRLGVVAVAAAGFLIIVAGVMLAPIHLFLSSQIDAKNARLANIDAQIKSSDQAALSVQLRTLSNEAKILAALGKDASPSKTMRGALAVSRPGIILSGIVFSAPAGTKAGALAISGIAATREALRNYQTALQDAPFATAASLPVSAYAQDTNIAFTITVTLAP